MKAIVHHDVAANHDHSFDSNFPARSNVRRLPADVVGRSSSRFATTKMTFLCGGRLDGEMPGKFQRNNREINRSRKLMS